MTKTPGVSLMSTYLCQMISVVSSSLVRYNQTLGYIYMIRDSVYISAFRFWLIEAVGHPTRVDSYKIVSNLQEISGHGTFGSRLIQLRRSDQTYKSSDCSSAAHMRMIYVVAASANIGQFAVATISTGSICSLFRSAVSSKAFHPASSPCSGLSGTTPRFSDAFPNALISTIICCLKRSSSSSIETADVLLADPNKENVLFLPLRCRRSRSSVFCTDTSIEVYLFGFVRISTDNHGHVPTFHSRCQDLLDDLT